MHHVTAVRSAHQVFNRVDTNDSTLHDEGDAPAKPLGFLDVVRGQEDRRPVCVQVGDELANL
ncbi:hypothetical protein EH220_06910, partial [bacterium]